jgi:hypothetical protein
LHLNKTSTILQASTWLRADGTLFSNLHKALFVIAYLYHHRIVAPKYC